MRDFIEHILLRVYLTMDPVSLCWVNVLYFGLTKLVHLGLARSGFRVILVLYYVFLGLKRKRLCIDVTCNPYPREEKREERQIQMRVLFVVDVSTSQLRILFCTLCWFGLETKIFWPIQSPCETFWSYVSEKKKSKNKIIYMQKNRKILKIENNI